MQDEARQRGTITLIALTLVGTLNFVDRQILSVLVEPIKQELHFSDTEFGLLTGLAFSLFYALFGLPAAVIADRGKRVRVIAIACAIWSAFTAFTGSVHSFAAMAFARFGVGMGEAGGTAPSISVLSDSFRREQRPLVIGLFTLNGPVGVFVGAAFGGWAATHIGWRGAFYTLGIVGLIAAPLLWLLVREPRRGQFDEAPSPAAAEAKPATMMGTIAFFFTDPNLRLLAIGSGLSAFLSYGMLNWIPAYLMRVQQMPLTAVASWFAVAAGVTMGAGMVGGGALVNAAVRRSARGYATVPGYATLVLVPIFGLSLIVDGWPLALALMLVPMACCTVFTPASLALAQELGPRNARATVAATLLLMFNIAGLGLGPLFVGIVSDMLTPTMGIEGLRTGLLLLLVPGTAAIFVYLRLANRLAAQSGTPKPIGPEVVA
ncbi:spinster family MFS transporter [Sphingomonas crocodyli]|uniref:MFS transporter n=1 Tax=Sphingomonas crocodyli TaxID=1979270 RepID=A0A437M9A6_9SPHN|nr:MFS transporter [Sphingomonas crocodyli]RVT94203.1 MFS transporter [Sphingomonas crocodyli]